MSEENAAPESERKDDGFVPARAMVIVAHPDDIEFGCAGTIARWTSQGCEACYVICTSGDVGIDEPDMSRERAAVIREGEQRAAARVAGVEDVVFLREPDGSLENTLALRKRLVREIRRFKPEALITMDPTVLWVNDGYVNHPDHRAAAGAAVDAVFPAAGQSHVFQELEVEGLRAHKTRKLYVMAFGSPGDTVVDVSASFDVKLAALREHKSQIGDWDPAPMLREWAGEAAEGSPHELVESYRVITLLSKEEWERRNSPEAEAEAGASA